MLQEVRLTKLREADKPTHPNNIETGYVFRGMITEKPCVGQQLHIYGEQGGITSTIKEIISETEFRTHNSIFSFQKIKLTNINKNQ